MVKKERIREIQNVLQVYHKVSFNKLKKIVTEDKHLMAAQTFVDALKEGVDSKVITREEGHYKNRKIVEYSLPEYSKEEENYYNELISNIDSYEQRVEIMKKEFAKFNEIEKGQILFLFANWLQVIGWRIGFWAGVFQSSKFMDLYQDIPSLSQELVKLTMVGGPKKQETIMNEFFLGWNDIEQENSEKIDKLLDKVIPNEVR
jgi:hypothetical protein